MKKVIISTSILLSIMCFWACNDSSALQAQNPVIGVTPRYCNPLPMEIGPGANASGDVTVLNDNGKYYMVCTGGGAWVSDDMYNWKYQLVTFEGTGRIPTAPDISKFNGKYYLCGNDSPLYSADHPLGPYKDLGPWKNTPGLEGGWRTAFDVHIYVDDDNTPYLYWSGGGVSGIYASKLDPKDLTKFIGTTKHLITFNNEHIWERYGEMNEYPDVAWIEGPWVNKINGTYYLQYSASGTQWKSYANGYYTSKSPLGPYTYAPNNPLTLNTVGMVSGTAHGCIIKGPDNNYWQFYTTVLSNPPGGRRIGMDRVVFDNQGNMSVKITDVPQWAPGKIKDPTKGNSGSTQVTTNKMRAMNTLSKVSSEQPGRDAAYAVDNYSGTWWEPDPNDPTPTLMIELSPATRFDVVQLYHVDGVRLMFTGGRRSVVRPAANTPAPAQTFVFKYKIEVSMDGEKWTTVLDQSNNKISRNTIYEEIPPVKCRFARLVMTDWPKESPLGVIDFALFGIADKEVQPAAQPIPANFLGK
ncbi:xylan 1,4-beta-xylosidase [Parabacteroides sp. PFB2-10]|nr:xylan 1,4-beta-xylosidase [Parabacteroides sp. PFB2-10]